MVQFLSFVLYLKTDVSDSNSSQKRSPYGKSRLERLILYPLITVSVHKIFVKVMKMWIFTKNLVWISSPLNKKSYNICTYRQWQCDDFNFVSFCISDELFSAMIICPGTIHSEILNADMGFQIYSCFVEKVIIIPDHFSVCVCLDSFIHRFVWRSWYIFWFSKFFMVLRIWEF